MLDVVDFSGNSWKEVEENDLFFLIKLDSKIP